MMNWYDSGEMPRGSCCGSGARARTNGCVGGSSGAACAGLRSSGADADGASAWSGPMVPGRRVRPGATRSVGSDLRGSVVASR